jgi:imidazolonepropionase-like amidohydrolase
MIEPLFARTARISAGLVLLATACFAQDTKAFVGARLIDGSGKTTEQAVLIVRDGKVAAAGPASSTPIPRGSQVLKLDGKTIVPGLVNAHAHMSPQVETSKEQSYQSVIKQLGLYGRYAITTIWSLGGEDEAAVKARDQQESPALTRARIYFAGPVITAKTPEEARRMVGEVAAMKPDIIKIRVDDNLGTGKKMTPEVYRAVIDEAHGRGLRVAVHIYYLEDAKALLRAGADFIAHSVRDKEVDKEFISLLKQRDICYCPTFTRELSTFVYESTPSFFTDPFFLRETDKALLAELEKPDKQAAVRSNKSAQAYKAALPLAMRNLKTVADAGVRIAMGTDTGAAPGRFQGYFEHLELEMMAQAGLTPRQVLRSATIDAAACMQKGDRLGNIEPGKWADFVVLDKNPLQDIRNSGSIHSVWIAGNRVERPERP